MSSLLSVSALHPSILAAAGSSSSARRARRGVIASARAEGARGRRAVLGGAMGGVLLSMAMATARPSRAEEAEEADGFAKDYSNYTSGAAPAAEEQSELVKRLLAKSAENKTKNDAERFNYDKQYAANLAILNIVPDDQKTREKLSISRPKECDLPFFKDSPTCLKF